MLEKFKSEPVRTALYGVAGAVLALLAALGVVTQEESQEILAAIPAFVALVELLRSKVTPAHKVQAEVERAAAGIPRH